MCVRDRRSGHASVWRKVYFDSEAASGHVVVRGGYTRRCWDPGAMCARDSRKRSHLHPRLSVVSTYWAERYVGWVWEVERREQRGNTLSCEAR